MKEKTILYIQDNRATFCKQLYEAGMKQLPTIQNKRYEVRGQKRRVLAKDLAELYQVPTGNQDKAVKRHIKRFPPVMPLIRLLSRIFKGLTKNYHYSDKISSTR